MASIDWDTEEYEPDPRGRGGGQLSVAVRGADATWAARFNEEAAAHHRRGEVRGGRWGQVRYHEVESLITVDDLYDGQEAAIHAYLTELAERAGD